MTLNTKKIKPAGGGNNSDMVEPTLAVGGYPARVIRVYDLGLQPRPAFRGQEKSPANHIRITYELLDAFMLDKDGNELENKPIWIDEKMPLFSLEVENAKSTKRYYAIDPDENLGGDFSQLIDQPCIVNVVNNPDRKDPKKIYNNVGSVSAMREREKANAPQLVNDAFVVSLDSDDVDAFNSIPKWIQDEMKESLNWEETEMYKALQGEAPKKPEPKEEKKPDPAPQDDDVEDEDDDGDIPF